MTTTTPPPDADPGHRPAAGLPTVADPATPADVDPARSRAQGATEERARIARDLHDRVGQSLAHLAFELDRIVARDAAGHPVADDLATLRRDLRHVLGDVRDTLHDLRTEVTDTTDLASAIERFTARVAQRSGLSITLDVAGQRRLPLHVEQELWRIAQEAIVNAERHAGAHHLRVVWRCHARTAELHVSDDGRGLVPGHTGGPDSYGLRGMRERATRIGAVLEVGSRAGEGTTVRCNLEV